MQHLKLIALAPLIVACTPQDVGPSSRSAQFDQYPKQLFDLFEISCSGPGETFRKVGTHSFECRELLPPETAAFLILNYDGYPQDLPDSVIQLKTTKNQVGFQVDADLFLTVPQKNGTTLRIPVKSQTLDRKLTRLYRVAGGTPK